MFHAGTLQKKDITIIEVALLMKCKDIELVYLTLHGRLRRIHE